MTKNNGSRPSLSGVKFAFFGTPRLATVFLDELGETSLIPSLIVTTPDKPQGRGMTLTPPAVKTWALERNIKVLQPEKLGEETAAALRA
ncbi:MAG: hypothetical protein AAB804_03020, partial [Patescibacteria group bacterium]